MVKSFRFLLNFALINLGAIFGFAAIVIVGCYATGVPDNPSESNLFTNYYAMFPTMILLCLFLYAFALCTNNLNLGLSMSARRGDFFWAIQGIFLFYTAVGWALQWFLSVLPSVAGWVVRERWSLLTLYSGKIWTFPLLCIALLVLGCLGGLLMARSRILATLIIIASCFIMIGATMFMLLFTDTRMTITLTGTGWVWIFTTLPQILTVVLAVSAVGGEFLIWRAIQHYVVR